MSYTPNRPRNYREPAQVSVESRLEALERAEAKRWPTAVVILMWFTAASAGSCGGELFEHALHIGSHAHAQPPALERAGRVGAAETVSGQRPALVGSAGSLERALLVHLRLPSGRQLRHCRPGCEEHAHRLALAFREAGAAWSVDPWLLAAVAVRESSLRVDALGRAGERGIMQIHPRSRAGLELARRCRAACDHVHESADVAAELLARSLQLCGSEASALARYNAGRCSPDGSPYARSILRIRDRLRGAS